jgi:hypothetical protein
MGNDTHINIEAQRRHKQLYIALYCSRSFQKLVLVVNETSKELRAFYAQSLCFCSLCSKEDLK